MIIELKVEYKLLTAMLIVLLCLVIFPGGKGRTEEREKITVPLSAIKVNCYDRLW